MRTREEQDAINKACKFHSENINELRNLVADSKINLGEIDTSKITDMSELFKDSHRKSFSGIENWDTSNVRNMSCMFAGCKNFNQDLSAWDVSKVNNMSNMFNGCSNFNQPLNAWDVSNVTDMSSMFVGCESFKENLNSWKLPRNYEFNEMFEGCYIPKENLPQGITFKEEEHTDTQLSSEVKAKLDELPKEVIEQFLSQLQANSANQESEQVQENVVNEVTSENEQQHEQVDVPASLKSNQDLSRQF